MLKKAYSKTGKSCRVTFKVPADLAAETEADQIAVLGDFNAWDEAAHPLKRRKDGTFSVTLSLDAGQDYRFRYLIDGEQWSNETECDTLAPNPFGSCDSVIAL